jgi:hypothetical protein
MISSSFRRAVPLLVASSALASVCAGHPPAYPIAQVPFTKVRLTDTFWAPRLETNRKVTIPFGFRKSEEEGRLRNFGRAARSLPGPGEMAIWLSKQAER